MAERMTSALIGLSPVRIHSESESAAKWQLAI